MENPKNCPRAQVGIFWRAHWASGQSGPGLFWLLLALHGFLLQPIFDLLEAIVTDVIVYYNNIVKFVTASKQVESKTRHTGVIGLSAWGIIGVVGGSMLLGTVFYYAVLFYPILCKKERKYDIMELSTV